MRGDNCTHFIVLDFLQWQQMKVVMATHSTTKRMAATEPTAMTTKKSGKSLPPSSSSSSGVTAREGRQCDHILDCALWTH